MYLQWRKRIINLVENESQEMKMLIFYRFLSLCITSFFYFISDFNHTVQRKLFILISISISAIILAYLYIANESEEKKVKALILLETVGNCLILIPSGGLNSPYVWYALNTIMITAIKLKKKYCLMNLAAYVAISIVAYPMLQEEPIELLVILQKESNLIISFVLITVAVLRLSALSKDIQRKSDKVHKINDQLVIANGKIKESIEQIVSLYQAVQSLAIHKDEDKLLEIFIHYAKNIMKTETVFFIEASQDDKKGMLGNDEVLLENQEDKLKEKVLLYWNKINQSDIPIELEIEERKFAVIILKSNFKTYGILGCDMVCNKGDIRCEEHLEQLKFLAALGSIVLEKTELESINERLVITQEQNRIANEIHDSVLQRLFSMSFSIFGLTKNLEKMNLNQIKKELNVVRNSLDSAMKELRSTIYGLSWQKNGLDSFKEDIVKYIREIQHLSNVNISFDILGNYELLSMRQKRAIYRIICEGIANAVRHGKSTVIKIALDIKEDIGSLEIIDNGTGFDIKDVERGLGLKNIQFLTKSINGVLHMDSEIGRGTSIVIDIPYEITMLEKEDAV